MERLLAKMDVAVTNEDWNAFGNHLTMLRASQSSVTIDWLTSTGAGKKLVRWKKHVPSHYTLSLRRIIERWKDEAKNNRRKKPSQQHQPLSSSVPSPSPDVLARESQRLVIKGTRGAPKTRALSLCDYGVRKKDTSPSILSTSLYDYCMRLLCQHHRDVPAVDPFVMPEDCFAQLVSGYKQIKMARMEALNPLLCELHVDTANRAWYRILCAENHSSAHVAYVPTTHYFTVYKQFVASRDERRVAMMATAQRLKQQMITKKQVGGTIRLPQAIASKRHLRAAGPPPPPRYHNIGTTTAANLRRRRVPAATTTNKWKKLKRK